MKDRPEVDLCDETVCPSVRSTTIPKTEEKQERTLKGDETYLMKNNEKDLIVSNDAN